MGSLQLYISVITLLCVCVRLARQHLAEGIKQGLIISAFSYFHMINLVTLFELTLMSRGYGLFFKYLFIKTSVFKKRKEESQPHLSHRVFSKASGPLGTAIKRNV